MSEEQKQKARERAKIYYQKNREKVLARQKNYARNRYKNDEEYRTRINEYHKKYQEEHPEVIKASKRKAQRKYYQAHKDYYKDYSKQWAKDSLESKDKEIKRLNNIINELEKDLIKVRQITFDKYNSNEWNNCLSFNDDIKPILDKLKILKGGDANETV